MQLLDRRSLPSEDSFDDLLRAYFQAEIPAPWPDLQAPEEERPAAVPLKATQRRRSLVRGRLALAASIALLIGTGLWVAGLARQPAQPDVGHQGRDSAMRELDIKK